MAFNPFASLYFHLAGGRNKLLGAVAAYLVVMGIGWYIAYSASLADLEVRNGRPPLPLERQAISSQTSSYSLGWVAGAQALFLLPMAALALRKAVVADHTNGMLESHRLTPLSGLRIVLGYLLSAPTLSFALYGAALLLGALLSVDAGRALALPPNVMLQHWFSGQTLLLVFALLIGSSSLLFALHSPGKRGAPLFVFFFFGGGWVITMVPALRMIFGVAAFAVLLPALQSGSFKFGSGGRTLVTSMIVQLLCAALFLAAAARKVRRPASSLFGLFHGMLLVLLFTGVTAAAIAVEPHLRVSTGVPDLPLVTLQIAASLFVASILAYAPLAGAAEQQNGAESALAFGERRSTFSLFAIATIPLALTLIIVAILALGFGLHPMPEGVTAAGEIFSRIGNGAMPLSIWLMLLMDFSIFVLAMRRQRAAALWVGAAYFVCRVLPLVADGMRSAIAGADAFEEQFKQTDFDQGEGGIFEAATQPTSIENPLLFGQFSPIGTVAMCLWRIGNPWLGVAGQALLTAMFVALWYRGLPAKNAPSASPRAIADARPAV